jgi:hypothetical protein
MDRTNDSELQKLREEMQELKDFNKNLLNDYLHLKEKYESLVSFNETQKNHVDEIEIKYNALQQQYLKIQSENEELLQFEEVYNIKRVTTSIFATCFQVLELSKQILQTLFEDNSSLSISISGEILRNMFYFMMHNSYSGDGFNFNEIIFKVNSDIKQFEKFASAFATYISANKMMLPNTTYFEYVDFKVVGMEKPKYVKKYISADEKTNESIDFEISILCVQTKKIHKLIFTCDTGYSVPCNCFDVDILKFDTKQGFEVSTSYSNKISILDVIMKIIRKETQWINEQNNPHFSELTKILQMIKTEQFILYDCPSIGKTDFCVLLQDASQYALEFHGCDCKRGICISIEMLIYFYENRKKGSLLTCPFCKKNLNNMAFEPILNPFLFDLSCISKLQVESESFENILEIEKKEKSVIDECIARLESNKQKFPDMINYQDNFIFSFQIDNQ